MPYISRGPSRRRGRPNPNFIRRRSPSPPTPRRSPSPLAPLLRTLLQTLISAYAAAPHRPPVVFLHSGEFSTAGSTRSSFVLHSSLSLPLVCSISSSLGSVSTLPLLSAALLLHFFGAGLRRRAGKHDRSPSSYPSLTKP